MPYQLIPERLKIIRENLNITKAEAARLLNLSKIGYCRYEYGDRIPSPQMLEIIAQCFNTSVEYLSGLSDDPESYQIIVNKEKNPELFELIKFCKQSEVSQLNRLLAYAKSISKQ